MSLRIIAPTAMPVKNPKLWVTTDISEDRLIVMMLRQGSKMRLGFTAKVGRIVTANRTILKIDVFHIAHFEAEVSNFPKHMWKLAIPLKLWVPAHSEVR